MADDPKFILLGSLSYKGREAADVDLMLPLPANVEALGLDCQGETLAGRQAGGGVSLQPYEELGREVERPIDLFLQPPTVGNHQLAAVWAWRGQEGEWDEGWVAFSRFLKHDLRGTPSLLTGAQIVALTKS